MTEDSDDEADTADSALTRVRNTVGEALGDARIAQVGGHVDTIHVWARPGPVPQPRMLPSLPRRGPRPVPADLDELSARVDAGHQVVVLSGPTKVGKSRLALHWAHEHRDRWSDGQFSAHAGTDPITGQPVTAGEILGQWLPQLCQHTLPDSIAGRAVLWRNGVSDRRVLLLLDDVHESALVRLLLPAASQSLTIVTSRRPLEGLIREGAARMLIGATKQTDEPFQ